MRAQTEGSVLVVEDDPTLAHALDRNLSVRGYTTSCASTVAEAIAAVTRDPPALLLLDIDLPDGSGWEVLRIIRSGEYPDTAVIVVSALQPNPRLVAEMHVSAVLEKPFPMESLLRQVGMLLGGFPREADPS